MVAQLELFCCVVKVATVAPSAPAASAERDRESIVASTPALEAKALDYAHQLATEYGADAWEWCLQRARAAYGMRRAPHQQPDIGHEFRRALLDTAANATPGEAVYPDSRVAGLKAALSRKQPANK